MKHFYFLQPILITIYFIVLSLRVNPQSFTFAVIYFRDQSVFITWGGPDTFFLGGGGVTHLKILWRGGGGGGSKMHTIQLNLQYLFLTLVNMILQKLDCIATKMQK